VETSSGDVRKSKGLRQEALEALWLIVNGGYDLRELNGALETLLEALERLPEYIDDR
jgi:hypothetical protein